MRLGSLEMQMMVGARSRYAFFYSVVNYTLCPCCLKEISYHPTACKPSFSTVILNPLGRVSGNRQRAKLAWDNGASP